ncbi:hypothetical protein QRX50_45575 [Amycolatopsis carbonis]|uniref:DUF3592 domain-containing protein n=1 Tax=Amycolatopsis carbonis TaxID=715471 RepID=A0A9Y2IFJ3_9PSEU|nr:DUF3592 domain-containing protein [Amycolatopsis sp. 2-15]WIX78544.1 hypothetical protein QRX50_45575 [Amycolatopsis sp. 2-15]
MDLGMTAAGEPPRQEDDEPLLPTEDQPARRPCAKRHRLTQHEQAQRQRATRGPADPDAWDRALRQGFWRAAAAATAWFLIIPVAVTVISLLHNRSTWLIDHGTKVEGRVVAVYTPVRSAPTITVDYPVGDVLAQAVINRDSDDEYVENERVQVYYDPADPQRVRTDDEENVSNVGTAFVVIPVVLALLVFPWLIAYALGWARRRRSARKSGWEPVTAVVFGSSGGYQLLRLDLPGGARLAVRTVAAVRGRYSFLRNGPVEAGCLSRSSPRARTARTRRCRCASPAVRGGRSAPSRCCPAATRSSSATNPGARGSAARAAKAVSVPAVSTRWT